MRSKGNLEREIKFHSDDLAKLRERMGELEAERVGPAAFEDNWILDRGDELLAAGKILRLRTDGTRSHLTFKGPMHLEGKLKVREELEIGIESAEEARALFEQLGYQVVRRYQKVRARTFKGPMHLEGKLKVREELEIGIESAEEARALFEQLGYQVVRRYQKV